MIPTTHPEVSTGRTIITPSETVPSSRSSPEIFCVLDRSVHLALLALVAFVGTAAPAKATEPLTVDDIVARSPVSGTPPSAFNWAPDGSRYLYTLPGASEKARRWCACSTCAPAAIGCSSRPARRRAVLARAPSIRSSGRRMPRRSPTSTGARCTSPPPTGRAGTRSPGTPTIRSGRLTGNRSGSFATRPVRDRTSDRARTTAHDRRLADPAQRRSGLALQRGDGRRPRVPLGARQRRDRVLVVRRVAGDVVPDPGLSAARQHGGTTAVSLAGQKNPRVALRVVDVRSGALRTLYDGGPATSTSSDSAGLRMAAPCSRRSSTVRSARYASCDWRVTAARRRPSSTSPILSSSRSRRPRASSARGVHFCGSRTRRRARALPRRCADRRCAALTGAYAVASLDAVDDRAGVAYVTALYPTRRDRSLLRVPLDGGAMTNLTPESGAHRVVLADSGGSSFIDAFSSYVQPPSVARRSLRGGERDAVSHAVTRALRARHDARTDDSLALGRARRCADRPGGFRCHQAVPGDRHDVRRPVGVGDHIGRRYPGLFSYLLAQHGFLVLDVGGPGERDDRASYARLFSRRMGVLAIDGPLAAPRG